MTIHFSFVRPTLLLLLSVFAFSAVAQPPKRRTENIAASTSLQTAPRGTSYRDFPTAQAMPHTVAWRRDIYRSLDLMKDANATLYYPTIPQAGRENLFTYLFKLLLRKQITAYDTKLDANEDFSAGNTVTAKELMDRYKVFYEEKDGRIRVNDADIPSDEVKMYYIKESVYYDQYTATFNTRVSAVCPVIVRGDLEFGGTESRYPMFWVKYDDIAPHLGKLILMSSNYNNAATMSADDFFTMARYQGDIYRTVNLQDRLLTAEHVGDTALAKARNKIEDELTQFHDHVWGTDSVKTTVPVAANPLATAVPDVSATNEATPTAETDKPKTISRRRPSTPKTAKQKTPKIKQTKAPKVSSSGATYSVRKVRR